MNALTELLTLWLADYFLLATLLLTVALVLCRIINQPARRLVLARPTLAALFLLSGLCAMPGWSLVHLMTEEKPTSSLLELSDIQIAAPITQPTPQLITTLDIDRLPQTPSIQTQSTIEVTPILPSKPFPWPVWLSSIYLGVCLLFIVWQASGSILARRLLRQAVPAPLQVQSLLAEIGEDAKRLPNLLVSNNIQAPAALGVFQPTILLPQAMLSDQNDSLRPILAHELAHIRHGDLRTLAAARLLTILLWPQPLYWLLRRQVRLDQETLADAAAADVTNRTDYAEQLVAWARNATDTPAPRLASSVGLWESPSQLKHRVAVLLDEKLTILRTCTRRWRYLCTAFVATAAVGLSLITLQPSTVASGKPDNGSTIAELSEEQQLQVRLAIEILSKPGLVDPVEEWGPAVQTLVEIGPPAVPSLIEALDEEVLDHPIRKIAFTLRAINDKRAIPALIRAIPRTLQPPASDYGLEVKDNDLSKFLRQYDTENDGKSLTYGRAFREVALTLQKMTDGVSHGEMELNFVHKQGTPSQQALQKKLFEKAADRWARWWEENWEDYVSDSHYAKVGLPSLASPSRQSQIADKSVHFPVGDDVRLSEGTSGVTISPAENPRRNCFYDLDTGRQAGWPSELPAWGTVDENSPEVIEWARKEGFDLLGVLENENDSEIKKYAVRMLGMRAWQITDTQFKELPKAMQGEVPYPLNKKVQRMEVLHDPGMSGPYRNFEGNPYLFLTREGNHGVLKLSEPGSFPYPSVKAEVKFFIQSNDASKPRKAEWRKETGTHTFTVDLTEATPLASSQKEKPNANGTLILATPPADADARKIIGRVLDLQGKPIVGAEVGLVLDEDDSEEHVAEFGFESSTTTDENGAFVISFDPVLRKSLGSLWAFAQGYSPSRLTDNGLISWLERKGDSVIRLSQAGKTQFQLLDDQHQPVAGASVTIEKIKLPESAGLQIPANWASRFETTTDDRGFATISSVLPNSISQVRVDSQLSGEVLFNLNFFHNTKSANELPHYKLPIPASGRVTGKIVTTETEAPRKVQLKLTTEVLPAFGTRGGVYGIASTESNSDGRFEVPVLAAGSLSVYPQLDEDQPWRANKMPSRMKVLVGETTALDFSITRGVRVRGLIRKQDTGEGYPKFSLSILYGYSGRRYAGQINLKTDSQGKYEAYVPAGTVELSLLSLPRDYRHAEWWKPNQDGTWGTRQEIPDDVRDFQFEPIDLVPTKLVTGKLVDRNQQPLVGWNIDGFPEIKRMNSFNSMTDKEGRFSGYAPETALPKSWKASFRDWSDKYDFEDRDYEPKILSKSPLLLQIDVNSLRTASDDDESTEEEKPKAKVIFTHSTPPAEEPDAK